MAISVTSLLRKAALIILILFSAVPSQATHIFGIDMYYTWVSGNTYTIHLVVYGDCSGGAFSSLPSSIPEVDLYNGGTLVSSNNLTLQAPVAGIEVTPVCPADLDSTTCTSLSHPIPGIKKFVYTDNITVTGLSAVWRFLFQGNMGASVASAGRSNSITNIASGTIIQLVDTLNNTTFNNSNAVYTTIPTPFYCLDIPANFNPGAVDPNGDSLVFNLVPGIDGTTGSTVSYVVPYTATAPIGAAAGTYSFSSTTGQLAFTPNILQKALVVYNVEEYHAGVLRGTSQREMTVVVISPCSNIPPNGSISGASAGTVTGTTISLCQSVGPFTFHINPTDPGGNHITMTVSGLPAGATFNIVGNGTLAPLGTFSWNTTGIAPGNYIFYINYADDGCPLSGQQTIAYTVTVLPMPTETYALVSAATCTAKAVFHVTPGGSASPWSMQIIQAGVTIGTLTGITGMVTDSLVAGTYTIKMTNPSGCFVDTTITIVSPPLPSATVVTTPPLCPGGSTGTASVTGSGGLAPYTYSIGGGAYSGSGLFSGLTPGSYVMHIKDANSCVKDTTITVPNATPILWHFDIHKPLCNTFTNGYVIITAYNSIAPYTYAIGTGAYTAVDSFGGLGAGTYTFHVKNANACEIDTTITLVDSEIIHSALTISPILCHGGTGTVTMVGSGGFGPPYTYAYNTNPFGATDAFTFTAGTYTMHIKDAENCFFDTSMTLTQPTAITITTADTNVHCNGAATGIIVVTATGGTPAYQYTVDGGTWGASNILSGLTAGGHAVGVKDANGCIYNDSVTLTQPTPVHIDSVSLHQPACNGGSDGSLTMYVSGGIAPYTYALGTGTYGTASLFSGLAAGIYTLHTQDANACEKDTTITLSQPTFIIPSAVVIKSTCATLANGKVTISATGGTPGYTYAVGAGAYSTTASFTPLAAGTYIFHVKDANLCVHDTSIIITDSLVVSATFIITPALCYNQATGIINVTGTGGISPYSFSTGTAPFGTAHIFDSLLTGTYVINVKDANGCTFDTSVSVSQPAILVPGVAITEPSCYGLHDGSITLSATGGTPSYTFSYNTGVYSATTIYGSLSAGTDSFYVKDANGCLQDTVFTISQPARIYIADVSVSNISCYNGSNGSVTVTGAGATPPYMYSLNSQPYQVSNIYTGLTAGVDYIQVEDIHGCTADTTVVLTQPTKLKFTGIDSLNPTCPGFNDGSVKITATGGTLPYAYSDDNTNFSNGNGFDTLLAGTYTFYVKDSNGCSIDTTLTLTSIPPIITDSVVITPPLCFNAKNGAIHLYASGGAPPLYYQLGSSTLKLDSGVYHDLYAGQYTITITDSRSCKADTTVNITQPDSLNITDSVVLNICTGTVNKGAVMATVTGGTGPYTYLWSNTDASTTAGIFDLKNGKYTVWVKDANNCTDSSTSTVDYDDCCNPILPNAFTPNGDGLNDIYRFRFTGDMYIVRFSIYNRFGEEVYNLTNTANIDQGWDGYYKGIPAEMGNYYWYAKIVCGNKGDHTKEMKGDVTLIR